MTKLKIGMVSLPAPSHLDNMLRLGQELISRGHEISYYGFLDTEEAVITAGIEFISLAEKEFPKGSYELILDSRKNLTGKVANQKGIQTNLRLAELYLKHLPKSLTAPLPQFFIYDHFLLGISCVFEAKKIPAFEFCNAIPVVPSEFWIRPIPNSPFEEFTYNPIKILANLSLAGLLDRRVFKEMKKQVNQYRIAHGLRPMLSTLGLFNGKKLATFAQLIPALDFPSFFIPNNFFYCGSFSQYALNETPFPFDKLSEKPIIYTCFGTLLNGNWELYQLVDQACASMDVQLVMSLGKEGRLTDFPLDTLSKNTIIVEYAPQKELIKRATLVINHAGLNSVIETLLEGKPMICIPLAYDQPSVANRMQRVGVGETIPLKKLSLPLLIKTIKKVLASPSYCQKAKVMQEKLQLSRGIKQAADIIEASI